MAENRETEPSNENAVVPTGDQNSNAGSSVPLAEKGPNVIKPEFVANFLSLEVSFVTNLPEAVIQRITAKANEFEAIKSQKMLDEVNYEQTIHNNSKNIQAVKEQLEQKRKEVESANSSVNTLRTERAKLEEELEQAKSTAGESSDQVKTLQSRIDNIAEEKRQTLDTLERRNKDLRELRSELEASQNKNLENRKVIVDLENQLQQTRSNQMSSNMREQTLKQEKDSLERNNEWLDSELSAKNEEFKRFKSEKMSKITSLQSEVDSLRANYDSTSNSYNQLKDRFTQLSADYENSLVKVKDLQNAKASSEESFKAEMSSQKRLGELWERSAKEAKNRVEDLEKSLQHERESRADEIAKWKSEAEREKHKASRLKSQLNALEIQLEEAHTDQSQDNNRPSGPATPVPHKFGGHNPETPPANKMTGTPGSAAVFSPSAQIISDIQRNGGSLVQLYSDFQDTKNRLEREKYKNEALRLEMDHILEEMESHAPAILAEREESKRLEGELAELSVQLERSNNELDEVKSKLKTAEISNKDSEREQRLLSQQVKDLSRQVQNLLIQIQMLTDSEPPLNPDEHSELQKLLNGESNGDESDTDRLISQRLVLFKNIIEMQKQNENLLKVTRELGQKMEQEEQEAKKKMESLESSAVEEAKEAIKALQEDLARSQNKVSALQRERDMFRRMASNKENTSDETNTGNSSFPDAQNQRLIVQNEELANNLKEVKQEFENYRTESNATVKSLNDQITNLNQVRSELQVRVATTQSQLEFSNERYKNLTDDMQLLKSENTDLKNRNYSLQESLSKQDMRTQQVAEQLVDAKSLSESMKKETDNLKAEKALWKSIESRLTKERDELIEERGRLNGVLSNLQSMESEKETSFNDARRRWNAEAESLQVQVANLQKRLEAESEEVKRISVRKDTEAAEYRSKLDKAHEELSATRQSLSEARIRGDELESKAKELEIQLQSHKEKLEVYQNSMSEGEQSTEVRLREEISSLKAELEVTKHELQLARDHVNEMTDVAKAAEEALQSLSNTHDEYKDSIDRSLQEKDLDATNDLLKSANNELSTFKEEENKKIRAVEEEKSQLESTLNSLRYNETRLNEMQQSLKDDLEGQRQIAKEAQDNYEKELVKHAEAANTVQHLRSENGELKEKMVELTSKAESAAKQLNASEASWDSQKYEYEHEIEQLKSRVEDLSSQNKVLLEQLESLSSRTSREGGDEGGDEVQGDEHLKEVINYLKREKEIVECNYGLCQQEAKRLKQRLDYTQTELDQVKIDLEKERQREDETLRSATEHEKLIQQLNELNVLRESNSQLRANSEYYNKRAQELEVQLQESNAKLEPLQTQLREAVAESEAHQESLKLAQEDNTRWKNRIEQILQKYERIDPQELQNLKNEVSSLKETITILEKEKSALSDQLVSLQKVSTEKDALEKKLSLLQSSLEKSKSDGNAEKAETEKQIASLQSEKEMVVNEKVELESKLANTESEYSALNKKFEKLMSESKEKLQRRRTEAAQLKEEITKHKTEVESLQQQLEEAKGNGQALEFSNNERVEELSKEVEETKAALEKARADSEQAKQSLQEDKDRAVEEKEKAEKAITEKEGRISELESQVNRLSDEILELQKNSKLSGDDATTELANVQEAKSSLEKEAEALKSEKASLEKSVETLEEENKGLKEQVASFDGEKKSLKEKVSELEKSASDSVTTEDHEKKLQELRETLEKEKSEAIEKAASGDNESSSIDVEKLRNEIRQEELGKFKEVANEKINVLKEHLKKKEEEHKQTITNLEEKHKEEIEQLKKTSGKQSEPADLQRLREALEGQHEARIKNLRAEFDEEKKKSNEEVRQQVKKEYELRTKLLQQRIDTLANASKEQSSSGSADASSTGPKQAKHISIKGQGESAQSVRRISQSGGTTASMIPRPGGTMASRIAGSGGVQKPTINRPQKRSPQAGQTLGGNKRSISDQSQQDQKRRKEGDS
ncbi:hypothetical protein TRICI_006525 [Trichomonascus ciferrii]|uniref:Uncharacterized protein n=1 Tax=Trichomonascus ciferrii TaxID=44093 RepID=A0A6A1LJY8_9ASCO|nr:hypothetical protein TRICI_006525 [Trichomonascus ciferrii]